MREKFDSLLTCGVSSRVKAEVEAVAALDGLSQADFVRLATMRELRRRQGEEKQVADNG